MNNRWIIISIIFMITIICILSFLIILLKSNDKMIYNEEEYVILTTDTSYTVLESRDLFYTIQDCVNNYYTYITQKNNEAIYSLLNEEYIKSNNIIAENVFNKIENIDNFEKIFVNKVYYKEIEFDKETQYHIKCTMISNNYTNKEEIYLIANFDFFNNTYSITPCNNLDNMDFEEIIEELKEQDDGRVLPAAETKGKGKDIKTNNYNVYSIRAITDLYVIRNYIDIYKINAKYFTEDAYNVLDEEYKKEKFRNIEDYIIYTKQNISKLDDIYQYQTVGRENYTEYVSIDKENNKIVLKETLPMQFTIKFCY